MIPQWKNHFGKRKACYKTLWLCSKAPKILFCQPYWSYLCLQQFHKFFNMKHSNRIHRKREWCKSAVIWLEKTREIASIYFWRGWVIDLQVWIELNLGWLQPNQAKYIFNWNSSKQFLLLTFNLPLHRSVRSFWPRAFTAKVLRVTLLLLLFLWTIMKNIINLHVLDM